MKLLLNSVLISFLSIIQVQSSEIRTNIEIVDSLTNQVLQKYRNNSEIGSPDTLLIIVNNLDRDARNYLQILIGNHYSKKSFKVFRNYNEVSSFEGVIVEIDNFDVDINYSKPYDSSFFGKSYVRRQIHYKIRGQFYKSRDKQVEQALDKETLVEDEIPYERIADVEESPYKFTQGKRADFTFWEKVSEPVVTVAAVAIIVYLFFTQRT
jgi:hypothetical protein